MSEEFSKLNKTIASFMLTSLAISGSAFAIANENLIADAMGGMMVPTATNVTNELYGVPTAPTVIPTVPPANELYAPPNSPLWNREPTNELYGVPTVLNIRPADLEATKQQIYNMPAKDIEGIQGNFNITKQINKNNDSETILPVNYVAPIIIPGYYIRDSK